MLDLRGSSGRNFSLVHIHLKLRIVFSLPYGVVLHLPPLCFYSCPEQTNQTLTLERAFHILALGSPTCLEGGGRVKGYSVCCSLQPHH